MNTRNFGKKFLDGVAQGAGLFFAVAFLSFAYAAATWGALPNATTGTPVSSSAWNDIVSQVNGLASAMSVSSGNVSLASGKTVSAGKVQITDTVTEGTACSPNGLLAADSNGATMYCQSSQWTKSGQSSGVYTFKVSGHADLFQGRGTYDSVAGTFSGEMICDPTTVNTYCGANGHARCGSNVSCAIGIAAYNGSTYGTWLIVGGSYYYRQGAGAADVSAIPVNTVTKIY